METPNVAVVAPGVTGASMTFVGAVDECTVSVMRESDAPHRPDSGGCTAVELTRTGEVIDGKVRVHVVGRQGEPQ